jgi:uncharacterized protein involved in exopolysaccharide biosynthesis
VDPGRVLLVLRQSLRVVVLATLVSAGVGVIAAKTIVTREYQAQVILQWEHGGVDDGGRELKTVLESVKFPQTLEDVRSRLGLKTTLEALAARVDIVSSSESNVVSVRASASESEEAVRVADAIVTAFLEHRVEVERQRLVERVNTLAQAAEAARLEVVKERKSYDDFREAHQIANLPAQTQDAIERAGRLRAEGEIARVELEAEQARLKQLRLSARAEPPTAVLSESEIMPEARKLAETKADLVALKAQLSPDHPRVQALEAEVASLERRVADLPKPTSAGRTVGRNPQWEALQQGMTQSSAQREAALKRQSTYAELTDAAQAAVAKLSKIEGEASVRLAALQVTERHRDEVEAQLTNARDAARAAPSGFRLMSKATAPTFPKKSRRRLVALLSPLVGLALALAFVLLRALRGLRVHTATELAYWGRGPVVASSPWPRDPEMLDDLAVDLVDSWRGSRGSTLVLGFGEPEATHLDGLVQRLGGSTTKGNSEVPSPGSRVRALEPALPVQAVRRAARQASRILVLVESGRHSALAFASLTARLGRSDRIGFVLLGLGPELATFADRAGDTAAFWAGGGDSDSSPPAPEPAPTVLAAPEEQAKTE